ncbi:MAG: hypothetical protein GC168_19085 [Candidatus Hydrogenedens sp.]|nr:hypothetical protein [Candidatus Hydrogenedens sp.]
MVRLFGCAAVIVCALHSWGEPGGKGYDDPCGYKSGESVFGQTPRESAVVATGRKGSAAGRIIYVDTDSQGADDGSSWQDAFVYLQHGLAAAAAGDEVWVAEGTYYPIERTDGQPGGAFISFALPDGVTVLGGFTGVETEPEDRNSDPHTNNTVLSGDVERNDPPGPPEIGAEWYDDNLFGVVYHTGGPGPTKMDGFAVQGGYGSWEEARGAGIVIYEASDIVLSNLIIRANYSGDYAGGLYVGSSNVLLENVEISDNASFGNGGGLYVECDSVLRAAHCAFLRNESRSDRGFQGIGGGAIGAYGGDIKLSHCVFDGNTSVVSGGGISAIASVVARDCLFIHNVGRYGGAIYAGFVVANCIFIENHSSIEGGATWGSGFVQNSFYIRNTTGGRGGAFAILRNTRAEACTFVDNRADGVGGAVVAKSDNIALTNCVFWDSDEDYWDKMIASITSAKTDVSHCLIPGSGGSGEAWNISFARDLGGNIDAAPDFVDPQGEVDESGYSGDYRLVEDSPGIDAGVDDPEFLDYADVDENGRTNEPVPFDLEGKPRIQGATIDMGAYEGGVRRTHDADTDRDQSLSLNEVLRVVQLYNAGEYFCSEDSEDGYGLVAYPQSRLCPRHDADFRPQYWTIDLSELLRLIQLYSAGAYGACRIGAPETDDGFCIHW